MKIACIGWGSLIWDKRELDVQEKWNEDGPLLPIEFARQSSNGRITLVICDNVRRVQTLWAIFKTPNLNEAIESLRVREGTSPNNIHFVDKQEIETGDNIKDSVADWLKQKKIDYAIWTGLTPKFNRVDGRKPSLTELVNYLKNLNSQTSELAKEYIQRTPTQIQTELRADLVKEMNW